MGEIDGQDDSLKKEDEALKEELDFLMKELKALGKTGEQVAIATGYAHGTLRTSKSSGANLQYIVKAVRDYYEEIKQKAANYSSDDPEQKNLASQSELYTNNFQQLEEKINDVYEIVEELLKREVERDKRVATIEDILLSHFQKESPNQATTSPTPAPPKSETSKPRKRKAKPDDDQQEPEG